MYDFAISAEGDSAAFYSELTNAAAALVKGEPDAIANMANVAALIWQFVPDLNWAGFYRRSGEELVLGPFQGKSACIRIPLGKGVCGSAAETGEIQCVADVHAFPGHIACDADSRSELVVPIVSGGTVLAVLDLDSPLPDRFGRADSDGFAGMIEKIGKSLVNPLPHFETQR